MSGLLDTSMVVRYLMADVPELAEKASRIIDGEIDLEVTDVVLAETAYVLTSVYRVPRQEVVDHLIAFLQKKNINPLGIDKGFALQALLFCRPSGRVSFSDAIVWAAARSSGSGIIYSLDERFPKDGVEIRQEA